MRDYDQKTIENQLYEKLRKKDFKITNPRKVVIDTLLNMDGHHCTVEELYDEISKNHPNIGVATVYRTINMLYELRLVAKLDLLDGVDRYEILTRDHHHHHLVCDKCGKTMEVMEDYLDPLEEMISKKYNFKIHSHFVKFSGICKECTDRMEKNEDK